MRLIDADALKLDIMCVYGSNPKYLNWLNHAPTMDAVPVEFIKGEIKNNKGFYNSSLRRLLDAWAERKEHETD